MLPFPESENKNQRLQKYVKAQSQRIRNVNQIFMPELNSLGILTAQIKKIKG
jgi:hypothetical protein